MTKAVESGSSTGRRLASSTSAVSPWVRLESLTAQMPGCAEPSVYHAIGQADYIQVLCLHLEGGVVLVEQYRPVVDRQTIEFPGGLRDGDEPASSAARREVEEETGLTVLELVPLIEGFADVGRLTNQWYGFFAIVAGEPHSTEAGLQPRLVSVTEIHRLAAGGELSIPGNIALMYLAAASSAVGKACQRHGLSWRPIATPDLPD